MPSSKSDIGEHENLLASPSWSHCEAIIKSFEDAWKTGREPSIGDFLRADGKVRLALLIELAHVDFEVRFKAGQSVRIERYTQAFPELLDSPNEVIRLIEAEYVMRQRKGAVQWDEYIKRFPRLKNELEAARENIGMRTLSPTGDEVDDDPLQQPTPTIPGFEILELIGHGGMGIVYKALEPNLGRHVALKILPADYARDPDRLHRFLREAKTASGLNHPHICTIHALGEHDGCPFIVMEFIEGRTLQEVCGDSPSLKTVARLIGQAARALAAAHDAGVVHRDVKPENIMVRDDGYVKVLDFGLARRLPFLGAPQADPDWETDPGTLLGTVGYMSPEQANGEPLDAASDMFSLGIVLYRLATGRHPFKGESNLGTLHAIANAQPPPPSRWNPHLPRFFDSLVESMLNKNPRMRPAAEQVDAALKSMCDQTGVTTFSGQLSTIVHREPELNVLRQAVEKVEAGRGLMVCISGEPGIGKTTVVEDFLSELIKRSCLVARGHCSERLAESEAYLPIIEVLEDLLRNSTDTSDAQFQRIAPTWYAQIHSNSSVAAEAGSTPRATSQNAMLREFHDLMEELSKTQPVVLFLDDVHWADVSTVDLIAYLGRSLRKLRVLLLVTFRPTELLLGPHPFHHVRNELRAKRDCTELELGFLKRDDVDRYLSVAFPNHDFPEDFGDLVYSRTEGSPLFLADLLRYLRELGVIVDAGDRWSLAQAVPESGDLPESVRSMIQCKLDHLAREDRKLLAAASVQGVEFDSATVAGALQRDVGDVEERLQEIERVHGLVRAVREQEFPNRTFTLRFTFVHILYQQALYALLPPSRRAAMSLALAEKLRNSVGDKHSEVAAELGCLFEVGRDFAEAARQFHRAAENAARVFAHREAIVLANRALRLLENLPESPERDALELPLQTFLGLQLQVTRGFAAGDAKEAYARAHELCRKAGDEAELFPVLWGLWLFSKVRSELDLAQEMADELRTLARQKNDPDLALQAHQALAVTSLCRGLPDVTVQHTEHAATLYDPSRHRTHSFHFGQDPGVICKAIGAVALCLLGYPDQAMQQSDEAIEMSRDLSPSSQAVALHFAAMLHQIRRDAPRTKERAETSCAIAVEHGFSFWLAGGTVLAGWARAADGALDEAVAHLQKGLDDWSATESVTYQTYFLGVFAEVLINGGRHREAQQTLRSALELVRRTQEGLYEPELHRLNGEAILSAPLADNPLEQAEQFFLQALEGAQAQQARLLELRSAVSLLKLQRRPEFQGKSTNGRQILQNVYDNFSEGHESPDLQEARALLQEYT